jgi:hypothetical protein
MLMVSILHSEDVECQAELKGKACPFGYYKKHISMTKIGLGWESEKRFSGKWTPKVGMSNCIHTW